MPIFKAKNENFFKRWTPEMAYVLGFFTADGNMIKNKRGAHFIEFQITDKNLLERIRGLLGSNHKIAVHKRNTKWKPSYRLQIGSKTIFHDLLKLGLTPNKSRRLNVPNMPKRYFPDFIRGYFDGDGCVSFGTYSRKDRKNRAHILITRFTSGNKKFLENLLRTLKARLHLRGGFITSKKNGFDLVFSIKDSLRLCRYIYEDIKHKIFLKRKFDIFQKALNYWGV